MIITIEEKLREAGFIGANADNGVKAIAARYAVGCDSSAEAQKKPALLQDEFIIDCLKVLPFVRAGINPVSEDKLLERTINLVTSEYDGRLPTTWKSHVSIDVAKSGIHTYFYWRERLATTKEF